MTTIDTTPEIQTPEVQTNASQKIVRSTTDQLLLTNFKGDFVNVRPKRYLEDENQYSFSELSKIDRFIMTVDWNATQEENTVLATIPLTFKWIEENVLFRNPPANYWDFDSLVLTIDKNTNAFYQGKLLFIYFPLPTEDYYYTIFDFPDILKDYAYYSQFDYVEFDPRNTNTISIRIQNLVPFDFIRRKGFKTTNTTPMSLDLAMQEKYLSEYSMGFIKVIVLNKLRTNMADTSVPVQFMVRLEGSRFAGRNAIIQ